MKPYHLTIPALRGKIYAFLLFLMCGCFIQCSDNEDVDFYSPSSHTLLVYIAGDNSLTHEANRNILSMERGLLESEEKLNLLIFKDSRDKTEAPALFELRRNGRNEIDTLYIARYGTDIDATSPEVMRSVVEQAFSLYQPSLKGLILWSHAMSWIPSPSFNPQTAALSSPAPSCSETGQPQMMPAYFGQDNNQYMELWELRSVLEQVPVTDYILVDACHFASAETVYELKDVTRYLLAAPTEVMGSGFPYQAIIPILSRMTTSTIEQTLIETAQAFATEYRTNGTITLMDVNGIENLATRYASFRNRHSEILSDMTASPAAWHKRLQHYGRRTTGALYYFYDFEDVILQMADMAEVGEADNDVMAIQDALNDVIRYAYYSNDFSDGRENLHIDRSCGLAVSLPELFSLSNNGNVLSKAYPLTLWGARMQRDGGKVVIQ